MRRTFTAGLMAACLILAMFAPTAARAHHKLDGTFRGSHQAPSCIFRYLDGDPSFDKGDVRATIRCAVRRWPVPGGLETALYIARRESGLNWNAANPTSSASGVYQFVSGTWYSQVSARRDFIKTQHLSSSVWNARSNVLIAIRSAHGAGWGPWGM